MNGTSSVLWAILDKVVDDFVPVIEGHEQDVEEVEATAFAGSAAVTERIYRLRREATDFYRAVHPSSVRSKASGAGSLSMLMIT